MPKAAEPPWAQPWSRATRTGVARRESPDSWPAQGVQEEGATGLLRRATEELAGDRDGRQPPRPPRPDAGLRSGKQ